MSKIRGEEEVNPHNPSSSVLRLHPSVFEEGMVQWFLVLLQLSFIAESFREIHSD